MSLSTPRLRMFAGPNGSGKSTLKAVLPSELIGVYLNPDEIGLEISKSDALDLASYGLYGAASDLRDFLVDSPLAKRGDRPVMASALSVQGDQLLFSGITLDAYLASAVADFLRQRLLKHKTSFTLETVMSHRSKIDLLRQAQAAGYRTYLYFVATDDPAINVSRVQNRVKLGGHDVPRHKIEERYVRSLDLLFEAIACTNRAYIFDNSGDNTEHRHVWLAEITEGHQLELKSDLVPAWFKRSVLDRIGDGV